MHKVPEMVTIQPNTEFHPSGARLAGSKNTPDPIMLPITSASAIHSPIAGRVEGGDDARLAATKHHPNFAQFWGEVHTVQYDIFLAEKRAFSSERISKIGWAFVHANEGGRGLRSRKAIIIVLQSTSQQTQRSHSHDRVHFHLPR